MNKKYGLPQIKIEVKYVPAAVDTTIADAIYNSDSEPEPHKTIGPLKVVPEAADAESRRIRNIPNFDSKNSAQLTFYAGKWS